MPAGPITMDLINSVCKALSSLNGLRVYMHLAECKIPQHVGAVSAALEITNPLASHHLASLHRAGLLNRLESGQYTLYSVRPETLTQFVQTLQQPFLLPPLKGVLDE